jgi:hypothetical protein
MQEPSEIQLAQAAHQAIKAFETLLPTSTRRVAALLFGTATEEALEQGFPPEVLFEMVIRISKLRETMGE